MLQVLSEYPDASLRVVGRDGISARTRGSYMESELLPLIPEKFRGKFEFSGKVPHEQMPSVIASAGICVYPSHTEAFPIAWIETLGMGRPIIGADIGAGREILRDGETGLLCDPHDPTDIAEKILTLLRKPELAKRIAKAGFTDFNARFDPERLVSDNIAFYETCIRS
jgi:glycosyltransferase involved in cell wall biosynthesis